MQVTNAIKKLNKSGFVVSNAGNRYSAKKSGFKDIIEFIAQDQSVLFVNLRSENDHSDSMNDYHAGVLCNNLTQALQLAR